MFKKIYATCRPLHLENSLDLGSLSLNGGYDTPFFNNGQFKDYEEAGITTLSMPISNNRYTGTIPKIDRDEQIVGSLPKLTRFIQMEYSDIYTNATDLTTSVEKSGALTNVEVFATAAEAIAWVKDNTDLVEDPLSPGEFLINPVREDLDGTILPATYLTIN